MLSVVYAHCRKYTLNAEFRYTECRYADCRYAECRYVECNRTQKIIQQRFEGAKSFHQRAILSTWHFVNRNLVQDEEGAKLDERMEVSWKAWGQYYKTFLGVNYANCGVFPYDFDWGNANSDVIRSKKFYNIGHWARLVDLVIPLL